MYTYTNNAMTEKEHVRSAKYAIVIKVKIPENLSKDRSLKWKSEDI